MKWLSFFKRKTPDNDTLDRYKQMRRVGRDLNLTLVKQLPKVAAPECGKKLGLFKAGTLILNNDDEIAVLYDYCLCYYRRGNKTVIERYLEQSPPPPESDEMALLQAMSKARYSLFRVTEIKPRQGAVLLDLVHGASIDLTDISLAETGTPGTILLGRVLSLADFNMSSGTMIPLPEEAYQQSLVPIVEKFMPETSPGSRPSMSAAQEAAFTAQLIRVSLHAGGADNTFYTDIEQAE